ncbi:hypothetical protein MHYP_G00159040 [Metynnis hypsauchen]
MTGYDWPTREASDALIGYVRGEQLADWRSENVSPSLIGWRWQPLARSASLCVVVAWKLRGLSGGAGRARRGAARRWSGAEGAQPGETRRRERRDNFHRAARSRRGHVSAAVCGCGPRPQPASVLFTAAGRSLKPKRSLIRA